MTLAVLVVPSMIGHRARPMFCTISTWEPRVSEAHRLDAPLTDEAFTKHSDGDEAGPVYAVARGLFSPHAIASFTRWLRA